MSDWMINTPRTEAELKMIRENPDQVYAELDNAQVKRTVPGRWRGMLPYLSGMAPAPTYANLSKAALDIATSWDVSWAGGKLSSSGGVAGPATCSHTQQQQEEEDQVSQEVTPRTPAPAEVDPLPISLPSMDKGQAQATTGKGSVVSVAVLPAFYRNSPSPEQLIPIDETMQSAELLGRGPMHDEMSGMEWFDRTGLARMQEHWVAHANKMDTAGKIFIEALEAEHANVLHDIAQTKSFDLKSVLSCLKRYTDAVHVLTLETFRDSRREVDEFGNILYHTVKNHFEKGLNSALGGAEDRHRSKLKIMQDRQQAALEQAREAGRMQLESHVNAVSTKMQRRHQLEMFKVRDELTKALEEAEKSITQLKTQEGILTAELKMIKEEVSRLRTENSSLLVWRPRFEKEQAKHNSVRRQLEDERQKNLEYSEKMRQQNEEALNKRDEMLARSRETMFRLEAELMTLRPQSPSGQVGSRRSDRGLSSRESSIRRVITPTSASGARIPKISSTPPLLGSKSHGTLLGAGAGAAADRRQGSAGSDGGDGAFSHSEIAGIPEGGEQPGLPSDGLPVLGEDTPQEGAGHAPPTEQLEDVAKTGDHGEGGDVEGTAGDGRPPASSSHDGSKPARGSKTHGHAGRHGHGHGHGHGHRHGHAHGHGHGHGKKTHSSKAVTSTGASKKSLKGHAAH